MANKPTNESNSTDSTSPSATLKEQAVSPKFSSELSEDSNYSSGELKLNTEIDSTEEPHKAIAKLEENGLSATSKIELARNGNGNASEAFREVTAEGIFNMYFLGVAAVAGIIVFVHFKEREQDDISAK